MNSKVIFNLIYRAVSIQVSGLVAGILATYIQVLSRDAAAAALLSKRRRVRSPNFYEGAG